MGSHGASPSSLKIPSKSPVLRYRSWWEGLAMEKRSVIRQGGGHDVAACAGGMDQMSHRGRLGL